MADNSWMGDEPLKTTSSFAPDRTAETPFCSIRRDEDLEVVIPSTSDIVCSQFPNYSFPMYEVVFKDVGFRLSFIDFQREVFRWTKLSPPPPQRLNWCANIWRSTPPRTYFLPSSSCNREWEGVEVPAGYSSAKKRCSASLRGR